MQQYKYETEQKHDNLPWHFHGGREEKKSARGRDRERQILAVSASPVGYQLSARVMIKETKNSRNTRPPVSICQARFPLSLTLYGIECTERIGFLYNFNFFDEDPVHCLSGVYILQYDQPPISKNPFFFILTNIDRTGRERCNFLRFPFPPTVCPRSSDPFYIVSYYINGSLLPRHTVWFPPSALFIILPQDDSILHNIYTPEYLPKQSVSNNLSSSDQDCKWSLKWKGSETLVTAADSFLISNVQTSAKECCNICLLVT